MDSEEYYDSLDEDSNYGSFDSSEPSIDTQPSKTTMKPSKIPLKTKTRPRQYENKKKYTEADDIVPFYDQSLSKSEIELKRIFSKPISKVNKKKFQPCVQERTKSTSYLDLFYAKVGVEKIDPTNRATCGDVSPKSYATCEELDIPRSAYLSEIESPKDAEGAEELSPLSLTSLDTKFCSISQVNTFSNVILKPKKSYVKTNTMKVPELGRLGPEIPKDKLELLKKRQDYGQKVSRKNKIKMMERKLLQNLQQEIRECKKDVVK